MLLMAVERGRRRTEEGQSVPRYSRKRISLLVMPFVFASGMRTKAMMAETKARPEPTKKGPLLLMLAGNCEAKRVSLAGKRAGRVGNEGEKCQKGARTIRSDGGRVRTDRGYHARKTPDSDVRANLANGSSETIHLSSNSGRPGL